MVLYLAEFRYICTVIDSLLGVEPAYIASASLIPFHMSKTALMVTHVPCFPVKPWNRTFVLLLIRRFSAVAAYTDDAVEYPCRLVAVRRAPAVYLGMACMIAAGDLKDGRELEIRGCERGYLMSEWMVGA
jgi:hypothetical protein